MLVILTSLVSRHPLIAAALAAASALLGFDFGNLWATVPSFLLFLGTLISIWVNQRSEKRKSQQAVEAAASQHMTQSSDKLVELTDKERARITEWTEELFEKQAETIRQQSATIAQQNELLALHNQQAGTQRDLFSVVSVQNQLLMKLNREQAEGLARHTSRHPFRVLLVDDNQDVRALLAIAFRDAPFVAEFAADGHEALSLYHKSIAAGTPYKLIVLDYSMPNMNGLEVVKEIRASGDRTTKLAFLTAFPGSVGEGDRSEYQILHVWQRDDVIHTLPALIVKTAEEEFSK